MNVFFLEADRPLTKTITPEGSKPYPMVTNFTSYEEKINSISTFHKVLVRHAEQGHCLLKGTLTRPLVTESRAQSTESTAATQWICLDIDGLDTRANTPGKVLKQLGLDGISYVVQDSASQGIKPGLRCHVFMMLDKPVSAPRLKTWLQSLNLAHFKDQIRLTASKAALRWPLDITVCQEDKLIYVAPPIFRGMADPLQRQRIRYSKGTKQTLESSRILEVSAEQVDAEIVGLIGSLRQALGLPHASGSVRRYAGQPVLRLKSPAKTGGAVTSHKVSRGFVYVNLEGGDSWGYYFPEDNPKVLYNFKGEPNYALRDIDPEFYAACMDVKKEIKAAETEAANSYHLSSDDGFTGTRYFAVIDRDTSNYLYGYYDYDSGELDLIETTKRTNVLDYLKEHGQPVPDFLPTWSYVFAFDQTQRFSATSKFINRYDCPVHFLVPPRPVPQLPPITHRVMLSAVGGDQESLVDLVNCLAYLLQYKKPPKTAFVLFGTQGTGKGLLVDVILSRLFGPSAVGTISVGDIVSDYNSFIEDKLIVQVDEIDVDVTKHHAKAISEIKKNITADYVWVNTKFVKHRKVKNMVFYIFSSNKPNPMTVDPSDRRFHIAEYQTKKLIMTDQELDQLANETVDLYHYLMTYQVDKDRARTPRDTPARRRVQYLTRNSVDETAEIFLKGDLGGLLEHLPSSDADNDLNLERAESASKFKAFVRTAFKHCVAGETHRIQRDRLKSVFQFLIGNVPGSPNKFTKYCRHHGIEFERMRIGDTPEYGIKVKWKLSKELINEYKESLDQEKEKRYVKRERGAEKTLPDHLQ